MRGSARKNTERLQVVSARSFIWGIMTRTDEMTFGIYRVILCIHNITRQASTGTESVGGF
jgi:hypothetical protein